MRQPTVAPDGARLGLAPWVYSASWASRPSTASRCPYRAARQPYGASGQVVTAYAAAQVRAARGSWDYADEAPLRDARGFEMSRSVAHPSQLTDEWDAIDDPTLANVVLDQWRTALCRPRAPGAARRRSPPATR